MCFEKTFVDFICVLINTVLFIYLFLSRGQLMFAEYGCYGPGSDTSQRVDWERELSSETLRILTGFSFINTDGWLQQLPS